MSEQTVETRAQPEAIWRIWADLPAWPVWNLDVEYVEADGPLAAGTTITLGERDVGPVPGRVTDVVDGHSFTLGFDLEGGVLSVVYRVAIWDGTPRVYHRMIVEGPNDQVIGQQMASVVEQRVPSILRELVRLAEAS